MPDLMDALDVLRCLRVACRDAGGQQAWASRHGLSPAYVSDVLHARRDPGPLILTALGLQRIVRYQRVKAPRRRSA